MIQRHPLVTASLLMLVAAVVSVMDSVAVRLIDGRVHPFEIVFFRNLFSMLALMLITHPRHWRPVGNGLWPIHIARAVLKLLALAMSFIAISQMPLAIVTAIGFTTPVFAVSGAVIFLREKVRPLQVLALLVSFTGVLVIVRPDFASLEWGLLFAFGAALALAAVILLLKVSAGRESGWRVTWINLVLSVPLAALMCIPFWSTPSGIDLMIMAIQGVGGLVAQLAVSAALRVGRASVLTVVDFMRLPLAIVVGLVLFGEPVDTMIVVGSGMILLALTFGSLVAIGDEKLSPPTGR